MKIEMALYRVKYEIFVNTSCALEVGELTPEVALQCIKNHLQACVCPEEFVQWKEVIDEPLPSQA